MLHRASLLALLVPALLAIGVQPLAPYLLDSAPLLLLVLHPYEPWSLLLSPRFGATSFVLVVVGVRAVLCCADYWAGRWYGPLAWAFLRRGAGPSPAVLQRALGRAQVPLLLLWPGVTVSVLAGATGVPWRRFLPLLVLGLTGWALLTRAVASSASGPLARTTSALLDRRGLASALLVAVSGFAVWRLSRRARRQP